MLETRSDVAVHFLDASIRGWEWAVENPTEAVDLFLERYPENADDRDFHLASFNAFIPLVQPVGVQIGSIDCESWLSHDSFANVESTDGFCTTDIFEQAINSE